MEVWLRRLIIEYGVTTKEYAEVNLKKVDESAYKKGVIRVKFSPEVVKSFDSTLLKSGNNYLTISQKKIDKLNKKYSASQYKSSLHNLYATYPEEKQFQERHQAWGFTQWYEITIDSTESVEEAIEAYEALDNVITAEPVYKKRIIEPTAYKAATTEQAEESSSSWTPDDEYYSSQWGYDKIDAPQAWEIVKGNPDVIVAVFDGGIQYDHPDLEDNMWSNIGPEGTSTTAADHATHVAGTIAATSNNSTGVAGCAGGDGTENSGVKLMSLDIIYSSNLSVYDAYVYAADHGAAISQNSWGYTEEGVYEQTALDGIDYFIENGGGDVLDGGIVIFAAGNDTSNGKWYPAYYSEVVAVAATNKNDELAGFSNYGSWVDICAPGVSIYSTLSSDSYGSYSGTSMACPHVSGVAALILSYAPGQYTNDQLKSILLQTADDIDDVNTGYAGKLGSGRVNAYNAVKNIASSLKNKPEGGFEVSAQTTVVGGSIAFADTSTNLPHSWEWTFEGGFPETSTSRKPTVTWVDAGTYDVQLIVTNTVGSDTITLEDYITVADAEIPAENPVQIGTTSSGTSGYPLGMLVSYGSSASIYLSSEIGGSGAIDSLAWYTTTEQNSRSVTVYLKETDDTVFTADTWDNLISDATEVFSGSISNSANTWTTIELDTSFMYSGTDNLMVLVAVNSTNQNMSSGCTYETTSGYNRHMGWTGTTSGLSDDDGDPDEKRPWIKINFDTESDTVSTNFYGYYNLFGEYFSDEDTFPPQNWTSVDNDGDGYNWFHVSKESWPESFDGAPAYAASYSYNGSALSPDNWLITNAIELPEDSDIALSWKVDAYNSSYAEEAYYVLISTTDTETSSFTSVYNETLPSGTSDWLSRSVDLGDYAGETVYVAFRHYGSSNQYALLLDDIVVAQKSYDSISAFVGESVAIYDETANDPIVWNWATPGAEDEVFTSQDIDVTYNEEGSFDVTLKTGNMSGSDSKTVAEFVKAVGREPITGFSAAANFTCLSTYGPFIPQYGTIDFTDESSYDPTSWIWGFNGASESASALQNPGDVYYKTEGTYDVSLIAANSTGGDTLTKEDYVTVGGTETITNVMSSDSYTGYYYSSNNYITGHNSSDKISKCAELYENDYAGEVSAISVYPITATGTNKYVTFCVWSDDDGLPGTLLISKSVYLSEFTTGSLNTVEFDSPIAISGDFFVGYQIYYDNNHNYEKHNFSVYMTSDRSSGKSTAYGYHSGSWSSYSDYYGLYVSIAIDPEFTYDCNPPQPDTIYGSVNVESSEEYTYYINKVANVDYDWDIPSIWTENSTTDSSITVTTGSSGGTITVTPSNDCGEGDAQTLVVAVDDEEIYTIEASTGDYGTITPSGSVQVLENTSQTFTIAASDDNEIETIYIDGTAISTTESTYTFTGVAADHTITVEFTSPSSGTSSSTADSEISVFPNPVSDELNISGVSEGNLYIYNSLGELVYYNEYSGVSDNLVTVDVSNLEAGMFIVSFQNDETVKSTKIVKN